MNVLFWLLPVEGQKGKIRLCLYAKRKDMSKKKRKRRKERKKGRGDTEKGGHEKVSFYFCFLFFFSFLFYLDLRRFDIYCPITPPSLPSFLLTLCLLLTANCWRKLIEIPPEYEQSSAAALLSPLLVIWVVVRAAERSDLFAIVSSQSAAKYLMGTFLLKHCAIHCNRRLRQLESCSCRQGIPYQWWYNNPELKQQLPYRLRWPL